MDAVDGKRKTQMSNHTAPPRRGGGAAVAVVSVIYPSVRCPSVGTNKKANHTKSAGGRGEREEEREGGHSRIARDGHHKNRASGGPSQCGVRLGGKSRQRTRNSRQTSRGVPKQGRGK